MRMNALLFFLRGGSEWCVTGIQFLLSFSAVSTEKDIISKNFMDFDE